MRRIASVVAVLVLGAALVACGAHTDAATVPPTTAIVTVTVTVATTVTATVDATPDTPSGEVTEDGAPARQVCQTFFTELANDGLGLALDSVVEGQDPGQGLWSLARGYQAIDGSPGGPLLASEIGAFNSLAASMGRVIAGGPMFQAVNLRDARRTIGSTCADNGYSGG